MAEINGQQIDNKELAEALIKDWENSDKINAMVEANKYYAVENTQIEQKKREYVDGRGSKKENDNVSNIKLPNAFLRKSVKQKVDYAFGKPPTISIEPISKEVDNEENKTKYQELWESLLNPANRKTIKQLAHCAMNCGIGYVYVWMDELGFHLMDVPSETIYPLWTNKKHTELNAIVRNYKDKELKEGTFEEIGKAELWTNQDVTYFDNEDGLEITSTESHMDTKSWDKIPYLWLKGTEDEKTLLSTIKSYVDAYDELNSKSVDTLLDDFDAAIIFQNYTSETTKLIDAYITLKNTKVASVSDGGGVSLLKNNPDINSTQIKLEHLKKDINEFSSTVNIQDIKLGNNPSGVAIKSAFQDLDTYINDIEMEFELFIDNLKYFYDLYLEWTGQLNQTITSQYKVIVTLDRDMMINESEIITDLGKIQGMVSQETLDNNNPYVESHAIEQSRRDAEAEKEINDQFSFPDAQTDNTDTEITTKNQENNLTQQ